MSTSFAIMSTMVTRVCHFMIRRKHMANFSLRGISNIAIPTNYTPLSSRWWRWRVQRDLSRDCANTGWSQNRRSSSWLRHTRPNGLASTRSSGVGKVRQHQVPDLSQVSCATRSALATAVHLAPFGRMKVHQKRPSACTLVQEVVQESGSSYTPVPPRSAEEIDDQFLACMVVDEAQDITNHLSHCRGLTQPLQNSGMASNVATQVFRLVRV